MVNSILAGSLTLKSRKGQLRTHLVLLSHIIVCDVMGTDLAKHEVAKWQRSWACFMTFKPQFLTLYNKQDEKLSEKLLHVFCLSEIPGHMTRLLQTDRTDCWAGSLVGAATGIIVVATKVLSQQTHNFVATISLAMTSLLLSWQTCVCRDKTCLSSRQNYVCRDNKVFSQQKIFCHDKHNLSR